MKHVGKERVRCIQEDRAAAVPLFRRGEQHLKVSTDMQSWRVGIARAVQDIWDHYPAANDLHSRVDAVRRIFKAARVFAGVRAEDRRQRETMLKGVESEMRHTILVGNSTATLEKVLRDSLQVLDDLSDHLKRVTKNYCTSKWRLDLFDAFFAGT